MAHQTSGSDWVSYRELSQRENSNCVRMFPGRQGPWLTQEDTETDTPPRWALPVFSPLSWWEQRAVSLSKPPCSGQDKMLECWRSSDQQPQTQNRARARPWQEMLPTTRAAWETVLQLLEEQQAERDEPGVPLSMPRCIRPAPPRPWPCQAPQVPKIYTAGHKPVGKNPFPTAGARRLPQPKCPA